MAEYHDFKAMEGARIQPLLGAIGALPGAALVVGEGASPGAPLLVVSLAFVAAAYMHWLCTDAAFAVEDDHYQLNQALADRALRLGTYFSWTTVGYGAASLATTVLGLAAMHSQLRVGVSVEVGFMVAMAATLGAIIHCVVSVHQRNVLALDTVN